MAGDHRDDFHIKTGRSRSRGTGVNPRSPPFVRQVEIAIRKAGGDPNRIGGFAGKGSGRFNARGRGAKAVASVPKDGGGWRRDSAGRFRARLVIVKARVVKLNPQRGSRGPKMRELASKAAGAHLRYLERDGVTRDGEKGRAYSPIENEADGREFIERGREDRHQFRFIVAPEDSAEMDDLRGFTRDLMRQIEKDLDTQLDWIAVDHHNTGHPHTHVISRAKTLERYGLATETEPRRWVISGRAEATLKELGERGDIIKTMHRALTDHGLAEERGVSQYVPHGSRTAEPIIGLSSAKDWPAMRWESGSIWSSMAWTAGSIIWSSPILPASWTSAGA